MRNRKKFKKSLWLPAVLALYCVLMSLYFGPRLIEEGRASKFWISVAFEAVVVVGLFFALRRKEKLADKWDTHHSLRSVEDEAAPKDEEQ